MVSQWRKALRRHSSSQAGSFFFAEIRRTISSLRPFLLLLDGGDESVLVLLSGQLLDRFVVGHEVYPF
jgi:hypothetical protein